MISMRLFARLIKSSLFRSSWYVNDTSDTSSYNFIKILLYHVFPSIFSTEYQGYVFPSSPQNMGNGFASIVLSEIFLLLVALLITISSLLGTLIDLHAPAQIMWMCSPSFYTWQVQPLTSLDTYFLSYPLAYCHSSISTFSFATLFHVSKMLFLNSLAFWPMSITSLVAIL